MALIDTVAKMLHKGLKHELDNNPSDQKNTIVSKVKYAISQPHPKKKVELNYSLSYGDLLSPTRKFGPTEIELVDNIFILLPDMKLVVYAVSCPNSTIELTGANTADGVGLKCIILVYADAENEFDLNKPKAIIATHDHITILNILMVCDKVDNVAHMIG